MTELKKHITIPKNVSSGDDLDYSYLRQKGQEYIEKLAGNIWTDYNSHDPGITTLEMLSYAITDLGARMELPPENLLAPENETGTEFHKQFFKASAILPSQPVTEADYRKLFIDIDGVKNCWLKPYRKTVHVNCKNGQLSYDAADFNEIQKEQKKAFDLQGLYSLIVEYDPIDEEEMDVDAEKERIDEEIKTRYHANRNLCEDLVEITGVETQAIAVCASIEVEPEADEELVHAKVIRAIDNYFSPPLKFYSLQQMLDKGYSPDEIFEGPLLTSGFIDPKELKNAQLRKEVRLSDLMNLISEVEGVKVIKDISMNDCANPEDESDKWLICIEDGKKPVRCKDSAYSYYKGVLPVNINKFKVKEYLEELEVKEIAEQENAAIDMELNLPKGEYLGTGETTTIQNDFPDTYGIGPDGLPARADKARRAKAKQLKGYLLFFDQVFASYFTHLEKVKDLLSVDNQLKTTYFTKAVKDIKGFNELVNDYPVDDPEALTNNLFADLTNDVIRKNKLLDHLIARFAEKFSSYAFLMKQLYGNFADNAILQAKQSFLKDYDVTSRQRGSAFNYFHQPESELWDTDNVSGVQKRIARLTGIRNYNRRNAPDSFIEIYDFEDSDGKKVYRWRIRNTEGEIILSATENYGSTGTAEQELYLSVVRILQTSPQIIEEAFKETIEDEDEIGNFEIQVSPTGKYSFDVINLEAEPYSTKRIVARQFTYYDTQEELKEALLDIISFFVNDFDEENIFIVEHMLFRPDETNKEEAKEQFITICPDDCDNCHPIDPYSYRITVILPGWTLRFSNTDFRKFFEDLVRKEVPAHVLARICWIGDRESKKPEPKNDMLKFQKAWKEFLHSKTDLEQKQNTTKLKNLINALNELNTIYPSGQLIDCDDEDEQLKGRIILGRTNIGNL
jgi:hypothetical protein